jgi:LPS export ABC transporter protein LptC
MKVNMPLIKIARRSLIALILLVLLAVWINYSQTRKMRNGSAKVAPEILSSEMVRSVESLEYSDYKEGVLHFKIHAQKLLESDDKKSYLEGIEANDFDPDGSVRNKIQSRSAVYDRKRNIADFSGDVRMFLGSDIELRTDSLHYNLNTNIGSTKDTLQFNGSETRGTARGVRFDQKRGLLDLDSEVDFVLTRERTLPGKGTEPETLHATSEKARFSETANRILFAGRARIATDSGSLAGDSIGIALSPVDRRVTSVDAAGNADYRSQDAGETQNLRGDRIVFDLGASGALQKITVSDNAMFSSESSSRDLELRARVIVLGFDSTEESLSQIRSRGDVSFQIKNGLRETLISGAQLHAAFDPQTKNVQSLSVVERASFSIGDTEQSPDNELRASKIVVSFLDRDGSAAMQKLRAEGSAEWRFRGGQNDLGPVRRSAWALTASVVELFYSGQGDSPESGAATNDVVISRDSDESSASGEVNRLLADHVRFGFFPKTSQPRDVDAEGNVRVVYERRQDSAANAALDSFNTESERMLATFELKDGESVVKSVVQSGDFTYRDAARSAYAEKCNYDAGEDLLVLEGSPRISDTTGITTGKRVEYDRKTKELSVFGNVRSDLGASGGKGAFFGSSSSASPVIVTAGEMRYRTEGGHARYTTHVQLLSESQHLQAQELEIFGDGDRVNAQGEIVHLISDGNGSSPNAHEGTKSKESADSSREPIKIRCAKLQYSRGSKKLAYSGNVRLNSGDLELFADSLDAFLDEEEEDITSAIARSNAQAHSNPGARREVFIHLGVRECRGDIATWYLDPGKFVVIGNPAEANDPERGRSSAHRLTYFTADDRILMESR